MVALRGRLLSQQAIESAVAMPDVTDSLQQRREVRFGPASPLGLPFFQVPGQGPTREIANLGILVSEGAL